MALDKDFEELNKARSNVGEQIRKSLHLDYILNNKIIQGIVMGVVCLYMFAYIYLKLQ